MENIDINVILKEYKEKTAELIEQLVISNAQISTLTTRVVELNGQVEDMNREIIVLKERIADMTPDIIDEEGE